GQPEIQEAGPRDLHGLDCRQAPEPVREQPRDLPRRLFPHLLERERRVGCEVTVLWALRPLDREARRQRLGRERTLPRQVGDLLLDQAPDSFFDAHLTLSYR